MSNSNKRNTQLANEILMGLFNTYKENQIRVFLATINRVTTQHYAIMKSKESDDIENTMETYNTLEAEISLDFYKEYSGKSKYSNKEIQELVKSIMIPVFIQEENSLISINLIKQIEFDYERKNFIITFNEEYYDYILLIRDSNYTVIDIEEIKKLKGKYEIGLYLTMWQFISKGKRIFTIDGCKRYFNSLNYDNRAFVKTLKSAAKSLNDRMGYDIKISTVITDKKISGIILNYKPRSRKVTKKSKEVDY